MKQSPKQQRNLPGEHRTTAGSRSTCFKGTPVPIKTLFDHLEAGVPLDAFLEKFPTVIRDQAIATLEVANKLLTSKNIAKLYEAAA